MNFRNKLILFIVPPTILMMGFIAFYLYMRASSALLHSEREKIYDHVNTMTTEIERWVGDREKELNLLAIGDAAINGNKEQIQKQLTNVFNVSKLYNSILYLDLKGEILVNSVKGRSVGKNLSQREGFRESIREALSGSVGIGKAYTSPATGRPISFIAVPVRANGAITGIIGGSIELLKVKELFVDGVKFGKTGYPYIINRDGDFIAHPKKEKILKRSIIAKKWGNSFFSKNKGELEYPYNGAQKLMLYKKSEKLNWYICGSGTIKEFYSEVNSLKYFSIIITILSSVLIVGVILAITSTIFKTIKHVSHTITLGADEILMASSALSDSSQTLSSSTNQQASSIEETSAALEEITAMIGQNLSNAKQTASLAKEMNEGTTETSKHVEELGNAMTSLQESNAEVKDLVTVIEQISEKTSIIDEIVFQTKLLSFNASVEAERAGEHGRGFAVVAQEVGNLAQMSGKAAQDISDILKISITKATETTQKNEKNVNDGTKLVNDINVIIQKIDESSHSVANNSDEISKSSEEQHVGLRQISEAVVNFDQSVQANAAISEESASASEELNQQAVSLTTTIDELKAITLGQKSVKESPKSVVKAAPVARKAPEVKSFSNHELTIDNSDDDSDWETL